MLCYDVANFPFFASFARYVGDRGCLRVAARVAVCSLLAGYAGFGGKRRDAWHGPARRIWRGASQ